MSTLTAIPGIRVGHASDYEGLTGCTVIVCENGAVAGADIRGGASGTQEIDILSPLNVTDRIHAVVLAGGSAFGLEAASGVRRFLEAKGIGYRMSAARVPLVPAAILYDLGIGKASARPTREMGEVATAAATADPVREGCVGAGTGATVGKLFGLKRAMKGGLGSALVELGGANNGVKVAAIVATNAFGDVIDPATGKIVAGARDSESGREFVGIAQAIRKGSRGDSLRGENTTLAVVATNAQLSKAGATKLAQFGQLGLARSISPINTMFDGDIVFAMSTGEAKADLNALGVAAADAVAEAVLRSVRAAWSLGGVPGLKER